MNDEELDKSIKKSFENFIKELATNPEKVFDNNDLQIKYNNVLKEKIKLQSNWNSLREWVLQHIDSVKYNSYDDVLDKMNELEGVSDEKI